MCVSTSRTIDLATAVSIAAGVVLRYGLVVTLAWIGVQKFISEEAAAIAPLIAHQPLMSWLYDVLDVQTLSNALGVIEIAAAVLIAIKPISATVSAVGSAIATLLFLSTVSFLFSTPGVVMNSSRHRHVLSGTTATLKEPVDSSRKPGRGFMASRVRRQPDSLMSA